MIRVAGYLRVSGSDQTTENQLPAIKSWCENHNAELAEVYRENESAWKAGHQRELSHLLDDVRNGRRRYDILLCWSLDRLSRQGPLSVLQLVNTFKQYGCQVISLKEPFTDLPAGMSEPLFAWFGWIAKWESDRRSERTRAGLERVKANGVKLGRPKGRKDSKQRRKKRPVVFKYGNQA